MSNLSLEVKAELVTDSSACKGLCSRRGAGKIRQFHLPHRFAFFLYFLLFYLGDGFFTFDSFSCFLDYLTFLYFLGREVFFFHNFFLLFFPFLFYFFVYFSSLYFSFLTFFYSRLVLCTLVVWMMWSSVL